MNKNRCKWLGLMVLSLATLLVMGGCGGSSSSTPAATPVAKVGGTVTFPTSASVSLASLGKRVSKSVALALPDATIELRDLNGKLIDSVTVTATATGTYEYSFPNVALADYVVKAKRGNTVMKAIVDKASLTADTTRTRNVDTASTTAVVVAEQKMGATPGTIGEAVTTANAANAVNFTTAFIASISPQALENAVYNAIGSVTGTNAANATASDIALMNLINIIAAAVKNDINPSGIVAGTVTAPSTMTTTQYTTANVATGGDVNTVIVPAIVAATTTSTSQLVYVKPPVDSIAFTSKVMDYTSSPATPLAGVEVTTIGLLPTEIKTFTDPNGYYTLVGIPKNTPYFVKMSKTGNADTYSAQLSLAANTDTSDRPYALWTPTNLTSNFSNPAGTGVVSSRVVVNTNLVSGYMSGVVVTGTDFSDQSTHTATYFNQTTQQWDPALSSTDASGRWMFNNVPAGTTGTVTATKDGYTFNIRTYKVFADSISQGSITGTAVAVTPVTPVTPVTTSDAKSILMLGLYELNSDSANNSNLEYFYTDRVSLAANGTNLVQTKLQYLDPTSKIWSSVKPTGFPIKTNTGYSLISSGWVSTTDGPEDFAISFNSNDTVQLTSIVTGQTATVTLTVVDIAGKTISSQAQYLHNSSSLVTTNTVFPAGSLRYDMVWNSLSDDYSLWDSYGNTLGTDLTSIPTIFSVGNQNFSSAYIDSPSSVNYYDARFVGGSSNVVKIYEHSSNTGAATEIGTGTYAISTVKNQSILEISIPSALRTQYKLGNNPIFALAPNGFIMHGDHSQVGVSYSNGQTSVNQTAITHILANITGTTVSKSAAAKRISKAILGF